QAMEAKIRGLENECRALRETLRDKFAGQAMRGLVTVRNQTVESIADAAYIQADAMLAARKASA
ncbi:MAG TPA: hypothetical protein VFH22_08325, partial [Rhodocyclaceae bacterium]|nr:hypothetical protein [Rhodocyclaceae bacterium]